MKSLDVVDGDELYCTYSVVPVVDSVLNSALKVMSSSQIAHLCRSMRSLYVV